VPNDSPAPNDSGVVADTSKDDRLCLARLLAADAEASAFAVSVTTGFTGSGGGGGGGDDERPPIIFSLRCCCFFNA
jgi:hypothetical protein